METSGKDLLRKIGKGILYGIGGMSGILIAYGLVWIFLRALPKEKTAKGDIPMQDQPRETQRPDDGIHLCTGPICGDKPLAERARVSRAGIYCNACNEFATAQERKKKFVGLGR